MIWNVYNRIEIKYEVESDPQALEPVRNPHFTYHPRLLFHLKSNTDRSGRDEDLFQGIADVPIVLEQDHRMPWIRAISAPISQLGESGSRNDGVPTEDLILQLPSKDLSVQIALDFIRANTVAAANSISTWAYAWGDVGVEVSASFTYPHIPTLSWFHSY